MKYPRTLASRDGKKITTQIASLPCRTVLMAETGGIAHVLLGCGRLLADWNLCAQFILGMLNISLKFNWENTQSKNRTQVMCYMFE
jgi:hypothetical protein